MPEALPVDWDAIREAAVAGVPFPEIAAKCGFFQKNGKPDTTALRQRCHREQWNVPRSIVARASVHAKKAKDAHKAILRNPEASGAGVADLIPKESVTVSQGGAGELVLASLEAISARHPLRMASYLEKKLTRAVDGDTIPEVTSWKDAQTADSMLRKALGLDKPQVAVQVNTWNGSKGQTWSDATAYYESEPVDSEE
jgi:hypothetical protein